MHKSNNKVRETLSHLRNNQPAFINSNKKPFVKETDHIEINALFGIMYLRALYGMNIQRVDYQFADEGHYAFGAIMSKNRLKFLLSYITTTTTLIMKKNCQQIDLPQCRQYGSCSIQTSANMLHQVNT